MSKRIFKQLASALIIIVGVFVSRLVLAQNFGTDEVASGLDGSLSTSDPRAIAARIINVSLGLLGVIALGLIIYAGFLWMTSGGEEDKISKAKKLLVSAAIGLGIILSSWAIASFVLDRLSDATRGTGGDSGCVDGETRSCGCNGTMLCTAGSWGGCVGSDCTSYAGEKYCDSSSIQGGCQADDNICAPQDYCATDCTCQPRGTAGDSCDADSSTPTCDANNNLCAEFLTCNTDTCTCSGPPVITGISPAGGFCQEDNNKSCQSDTDCNTVCNQDTPNGAADNFLTIFGQSFGEYDAAVSQVIFLGGNQPGRNPAEINPVCINSWSDKQIIIAIPSGASSGAIKVIRQDSKEDVTNDDYGPMIPDFIANTIVRPGLCRLTPNQGGLGAVATYQGVSLYSGKAYFGNYKTNVQALDSSFSHPGGLSGVAGVPNIRSGEATSFVVSTLGGSQEKSNYLYFNKESDPKDGPFIVSFSPTSGRAGQYVTITGSGFGGARGNSKVYFGSVEADYVFPAVCASSVWTDNQIIVKVPAAAANGYHYIRVELASGAIDTSQLNPNSFNVDSALSLKTSLCKVEPKQGAVSTPVKLYGEYFGPVGQNGLAQFNVNKNASGVISQENGADIITTAVPEGAITGPIKVVKNGEWGNELNFEVGSCVTNENCEGGQVCCPSNTYKKGRCVASLNDCLIDIPTSVFEWDFSTGYAKKDVIDPTESCSTLAAYAGACPVDSFCPNTSGVCSPYAGNNKKVVASCDYSCASVAGCNAFPSACFYDASINKCVKSGADGLCSLSEKRTFSLGGQDTEVTVSCNQDGNWQFSTQTSCPDNWEKGVNNICIDKNSTCSLCTDGLTCERVVSDGRCVSKTVCPAGSICEDNPDLAAADRCIAYDAPSCDCCCRIGNSAQDCCAPLECAGTCGNDQADDGAGLGKCSGCANVGTTQAEHDAACNCSGNGGQYCSITAENPEGVCTDCSGLKTQSTCADHSAACCFDARRTPSPDDDICRGGSGTEISSDPTSPDYGYCGYFNCSATDPASCASSTPVKLGYFKNVETCTTDCSAGVDFCSLFNGNKEECTAAPACCFDQKTSKCQGGEQIASGADAGYCAYYNCGDPSATPPGDPATCEAIPRTTGTFNSLTFCQTRCSGNYGGAGQKCSSPYVAATCDFNVCNYPNMACLTDSGAAATGIADCGTCCCSPADVNACKTPEAPYLFCKADQGSCSGASRGLCCGCKNDGDCGNPETLGCGIDTCCQARPNVLETAPVNGANNVCRNAVLNVTFDQVMDVATFNSNILLLKEMDYGSGVCPSGSMVYDFDGKAKKTGWLAKVFNNLRASTSRLVAVFFPKNESALAVLPNPSKLYCASPIMISGSHAGDMTTANIMPRQLMSPDTNYFLVVKGDEELNSQLGVTNIEGIGFNGKGLDGTEGANLIFNTTYYKNSHIIQFRTLSDKAENSGVCAISQVKLLPASYLFKTTDNDLNEKDDNPADKTFDTAVDKDKVFAAWALSADGQVIHPVTGYFWEWKFNVLDSSVASINAVSGLAMNRVLVAARNGVTEAETKLTATVSMERFLSSPDYSPSCVCADERCTANCANAFSLGDDSTSASDIYVFVCNNPWPPVNPDGTWFPWTDTCTGALGGPCTDFNYKFYYCRDAGQPGTADDQPAIINKAVIRGQSTTLACSSDGSACSAAGASCGADRNGDGLADGLCVWNVLKESYFFRESVLPAGEITAVTDKNLGGEVLVTWKSSSSQSATFKIYYSEVGKSANISQEFATADVCDWSGTEFLCEATISGLKNNQAYSFRVSVLTASKAESTLSAGVTGMATDKTPYGAPSLLNVEIKNNKFVFSWTDYSATANKVYRLYHGVYPSRYGESFDSSPGSKSLEFSFDSFKFGEHYFAVSSLDENGNESAKSLEINFIKSPCVSGAKNCFTFVTFEGILTNVDFEQTTASGLPQDWSVSRQKYSSVLISTAEHFSGKQSVWLHQDPGYPYPGKCNEQICSSGICVWNATARTCTFSQKDDCHPTTNAVYNEGQTLCWGNTNRVMWLRLAYNLAKLDLKQGDKYSISFYYKGKNAGNVAVSMSPSLGWSTQCIHYSSVNALKPGYTWDGTKITPTPPVGVNPCNTSYGAPCSAQNNYCCVQSPYQTACYSAINMPSIPVNTYNDWTWYYYSFDYKDQMASWLDRNGNKLIEMGMAIGYNSTVNSATDFYVDDFVVRKITSGTEINY